MKPLIVEMKEKPHVTETDAKNYVELVITVEKESSAKEIDLDISEKELKLQSTNYELHYKFKSSVDPESVAAKFNKTKKTLTLTINKV